MSKYGKLTWNDVEALINKMGGLEAKNRFMRGELKFVETGLVVASGGFAVWKSIELGRHKSASEYLTAIKDAKYSLGGKAPEMLKEIPIAEELTQIDLVRVSVEDLGFVKENPDRTGNLYYREVFSRAKECGLSLCPAEVGPALRLQQLPEDGSALIAMEPSRSESGESVFSVDSGLGTHWLGMRVISYSGVYFYDHLVFAKYPKP